MPKQRTEGGKHPVYKGETKETYKSAGAETQIDYITVEKGWRCQGEGLQSDTRRSLPETTPAAAVCGS